MEVGNKLNAYKHWKTQQGEPIKVTLVEFLKYYKVNNSYYYFEEGGKNYEGQIWKCRVGKKIKEFVFKVEVFDTKIKRKETTLIDNKNPLKDRYPNPIVDSWKECNLNIIDRDLFPNDEMKYIKVLQEIITEKEELYLEIIMLRLNLIYCKTNLELHSFYEDYLSKDIKLKFKLKKLIYKKMK